MPDGDRPPPPLRGGRVSLIGGSWVAGSGAGSPEAVMFLRRRRAAESPPSNSATSALYPANRASESSTFPAPELPASTFPTLGPPSSAFPVAGPPASTFPAPDPPASALPTLSPPSSAFPMAGPPASAFSAPGLGSTGRALADPAFEAASPTIERPAGWDRARSRPVPPSAAPGCTAPGWAVVFRSTPKRLTAFPARSSGFTPTRLPPVRPTSSRSSAFSAMPAGASGLRPAPAWGSVRCSVLGGRTPELRCSAMCGSVFGVVWAVGVAGAVPGRALGVLGVAAGHAGGRWPMPGRSAARCCSATRDAIAAGCGGCGVSSAGSEAVVEGRAPAEPVPAGTRSRSGSAGRDGPGTGVDGLDGAGPGGETGAGDSGLAGAAAEPGVVAALSAAPTVAADVETPW